ncbi:MAG TPA: multiheme c-type cytochrome [Polyangiaceae bacterium]|nr:multiheme c-type cytochrome [Polyangiaceae bacterium]
MPRPLLAFGLALLAALGGAACNGCRSTQPEGAKAATAPDVPTIRLYAVSNVAGALEPCGCTKDQMGGIDHLGAFIARDRASARGSLLLAAGPTMFLDPTLASSRGEQDVWKAEAIGASFGAIGLAAWTPGFNDWAGGPRLLTAFGESTKAPLLAANLEGAVGGAVKSALREVSGIKVGLVGVALPLSSGKAPEGVASSDPASAMKAAVAALRAQGAKMIVGLAAIPRGDALRLAEGVPHLAALVVGKPADAGDTNDAPMPPQVMGHTLVVQTSNHLQTVAVVDFFVRGDDFEFQDGVGVANAQALDSVEKRMRDLENRLAAWQNDPSIRPADLEARKRDLDKLAEEKKRLSIPAPPQEGSFFRYSLVEVRGKLGSDTPVAERMKAFYAKVNEHNRVAFADKKPPELAPGQSGYAGVEVCSSCHDSARKVWDGTAHAHAYATLAKQSKEFNLDCVGCHVTGYEKPGGSTVTWNLPLRDVQCESCHGPGQAHAKAPKKAGLITRDPKPETCVGSCHHPPHVEAFDPVKAKQLVLGPGHGLPE